MPHEEGVPKSYEATEGGAMTLREQCEAFLVRTESVLHISKRAIDELEAFARQQQAVGLREARSYHAIHLLRRDHYAVVLMEIDGRWVELIREHYDSPFSHIIEPAGIEQCVQRAREKEK